MNRQDLLFGINIKLMVLRAIGAVQRMPVEPFVKLLSQDVVHFERLLIFLVELLSNKRRNVAINKAKYKAKIQSCKSTQNHWTTS
jgi:hypothetical protein